MYTLNYYKKNKTRATFRNKDVHITLYQGIYKHQTAGKTKFYAAHVRLKNYNKLHLAKANGKRSGGFQTIYDMVHIKNNKAYDAALAVNGPFNGADSHRWDAFGGGKYYTAAFHDYHQIVGGKYYKGTLGSPDVGGNAAYSSRTGILAPGTSHKGIQSKMTFKEAAAKKLLSDTFHGDMGFTLLLNGTVLGNAQDKAIRARTFIGTNGKPGDIWIIVANGDNTDNFSKGINAYGEGHILKKLKCKYGYNLDGGGSSTMVFKGKAINKSKEIMRKCYDALYVSK